MAKASLIRVEDPTLNLLNTSRTVNSRLWFAKNREARRTPPRLSRQILGETIAHIRVNSRSYSIAILNLGNECAHRQPFWTLFRIILRMPWGFVKRFVKIVTSITTAMTRSRSATNQPSHPTTRSDFVSIALLCCLREFLRSSQQILLKSDQAFAVGRQK